MDPNDLLNTTDAEEWAEAFVEIVRDEDHDGADPYDADFMRGWFANAIEAGKMAEAHRARIEADPDLGP